MIQQTGAVAHDLQRLEESLYRLRDEVRDAQMIMVRLPAAVGGGGQTRRSLALFEMMVDSLREELQDEFAAASPDCLPVGEIPF